MREWAAHTFVNFLYDVAQLDKHLVALVLLLVTAFIVIDGAMLVAKKKSKAVGLDRDTRPVQIESSKNLPVRNYISELQGLSGRPDAVLVEHGFFIPVEVKPLAKKIRDRHIAQLLVYMRLIEEFEGRRPPYGYLILGANSRKVKIENTPERQVWLEQRLMTMRSILPGSASAVGHPQPQKCRRCAVAGSCAWNPVKNSANTSTRDQDPD